MTIHCDIVSQDRLVFSGEADIVVVPGSAGDMGILPHHAPLLTTLRYGVVCVRSQGVDEIFTVAGGIVEVQPDTITIMADAAENIADIALHQINGIFHHPVKSEIRNDGNNADL